MRKFQGVWIAIVFLVIATLACSLSAGDRNETQESGAAPTTEERAARVSLSTPTSPSPPTPLPESLTIGADAEEQLLINIYERVNPAVVNIDVAVEALGDLSGIGSGSGFVIDKQGHIVTNNHVIEDANQMRVTFADGTTTEAELVARDEDSDLAVIQVDVDPDRLVPLELGNSSNLKVGQRVIAIGNPWDLGGTMTVGIVSALGRTLPGRLTADLGYYSIPDLIQTDAAINPGNSGGPLLDSRGRVVGVNTAIRSEDRSNSGVGFAVPVDIVKRVVPALIDEGRYRYPYLGITANGNVTVADLATELDLPVQHGVLVSEVSPEQPAARAGLRGGTREYIILGQPVTIGGDIILAIDGYELRDFDDLIAYLVRETSVGQEVSLTVLRDGETLQVPVTLGERPLD
jgi:S1-C subfamily serine protease